METVYLLIGTNLGNREANLVKCRQRLTDIWPLIKVSSVYETKSWGDSELPDFLNQAIAVQTNIPPLDVLTLILAIEIELGRVRQKKWGSRIIDIDMLLFGNQIIETEKLKVPHPHLSRRRFALTALAEIAPDIIHPVLSKSIIYLWKVCQDKLEVRKQT